MQTSPISTEMSVRVHWDDLAREAEQYRTARCVLQNARSYQPTQVVLPRPLIWIRRLAGMVRGASA